MTKTIGLQLVGYSILLAGLGYLAYHWAGAFAQPTLIAGLAGGVLCLLCGFWALTGSSRKAPALLTLVPVSFVLLSQTVTGWSGRSGGAQDGTAAAFVITILLVMSVAMIMRIAYAGAVFDEQPVGSPKDGGAPPPTAPKPALTSGAARRA